MFIKLFSFLVFIFNSINCEQEVCFTDLGCFENDYPYYDPDLRPIPSPDSPQSINTKFFLTSKENLEIPKEIDPQKVETILYSSLSQKLNLKIIIHGFLDYINEKTDWIKVMTKALLEREPMNVIVVDWSDGAYEYTQAVANARVVGAQVAQLIRRLNTSVSIPLSSIQVIGHSLGAHVAGYAGKRLNGTLGRITGLAPAGLYFDGLPIAVKLDKSDAQFVDVIHTDSGTGISTSEPIGHLAFYPNGGHNQPHCNLIAKLMQFKYDTVRNGIWNFAFCDNQQSIEFYIEAIRNQLCTPIAYTCADYQTYLSGQCNQCNEGQDCAILGPRAQDLTSLDYKPHKSANVYLKMGSKQYHYCLRQYHMRIQMPVHPQHQYVSQTGNLSLVLRADNDDAALDINGAQQFWYNSSNHLLATTDKNYLTDVSAMNVFWDNNQIGFDAYKSYRIFIDSITLEPIWITDLSERHNKTVKLCPRYPNEGIPMQTNTAFDLC